MQKNCWLWIIIAIVLGWGIGWFWRDRLCIDVVVPVSGPTAPTGASAPPEPPPNPDPPPGGGGTIQGQTSVTISSLTLERSAPGTNPPGQLTLTSSEAIPEGNDGIHPMGRLEDLSAAAALASEPEGNVKWIAFPDDANDKLRLELSGLVSITSDLVATVKNPQFISCSPKPASTTNFFVRISGTTAAGTKTGNIETASSADAIMLARWLAATHQATSNASGLHPDRAHLTLDNGSTTAPKKATLEFLLAQ